MMETKQVGPTVTPENAGVLCTPGYEESGEKHPCFICGYEYDMGVGYFFIPCPRCGHDPEDWPFNRVIFTLSKRLRISQSGLRKLLSLKMGISEKTLKMWQYRGIGRRKVEGAISSFRKAVREILEDEEAVKGS